MGKYQKLFAKRHGTIKFWLAKTTPYDINLKLSVDHSIHLIEIVLQESYMDDIKRIKIPESDITLDGTVDIRDVIPLLIVERADPGILCSVKFNVRKSEKVYLQGKLLTDTEVKAFLDILDETVHG